MSGLILENVSKRFGGIEAVSKLSIQAPGGRITGLIGPNGAGKSTVVNLITGMFDCTAGRILFDGRELTAMPPHEVSRVGISRTFQNIRLLPHETVLHNVLIGYHRLETANVLSCLFGLPAARRSTQAAREAAFVLLRQFGMEGFADRPAGALSYGDQRRVEMMRALIARPRLLLLDEPIAGMNEVESERLGEIFHEIARSGVAVLLIEHDLGFVTRLCEYLYAVDRGTLIAEGSCAAVMADRNVVTAYLGEDDDA
ncbi:MAG TPA: ABC transporter ATP-binding protein [Ramlibacter sp.]|nr:ABC transporter ATP-binding protein [Ramlibacter sp.]